MVEHADDPDVLEMLTGCQVYIDADPHKCGFAQAGLEPCAGCKVKRFLEYEPRYKTTAYALFLDQYVEIFHLKPTDLSWRDIDVLQALRTARNQHQVNKMRRNSDGREYAE